MIEQCQLIKLTSEQFEALRVQLPRPVILGAAIVRVEPWLAKAIVDVPHKNRPQKERERREIRAAVLGSYWRLNGEPIILNSEMALMDGENRLATWCEAQVTVETLITWGWPQEGFATLDTGVRRSGGDTLSAAGQKNAFALSAAARYDWRLATNNMMSDLNLPSPLIEHYVHEHEGLKASLSWGDIVHKFIPKGLGVALHYRLSLQDASLAKQFFQDIAHGEDINRHHTTYWLRELLTGYRKPDLHLGRIQQAHIAANVLKGWHAVCAGRLRQRADLLWHPERDEPFPELIYAEKQKQPRTRKQEVSEATEL